MTPKNNESKMNVVKKKIIISMCAIILLVLTLFGITYAYFTSSIQGNKNDTSVDIGAAMLRLEYNGEDSYIEVTGLQPGETIESKKFSVKNTGTATIENYDVILENLVNELSRYEDLTYELTCTSSDGKECNDKSDIFPKTNQVIVTNTIDAGVTHSYVLKLTYEDTNTNQSIDMNKEISAKVNIKDDNSNIKTFKVYGNTLLTEVQTRSLTPTNEIEYLGDLVTDENDKNYGKYKIPVNIIGKNLFDHSHYDRRGFTLLTEGEDAGAYLKKTVDDLLYMIIFNNKENYKGQYTLSFEIKYSTTSTNKIIGAFPIIEYTDGTAVDLSGINSALRNFPTKYLKIKYTTDSTKQLKWIYWNYGTKNSSTYIKNLQVEKSKVATTYEPYKNIHSYIYLNEPLRKIGDVADYIDLENKIVVRRVGEKVFDGTENFHTYEDGVYYGLLHKYDIPAISNYYSNNTEDEIYFTSTNNSNAIHFRVDETADEFKTLLQERYNNNQPLKVLYALNEVEFESINVPDIEINNTNTINVCDTNNICASNIEVEFDE